MKAHARMVIETEPDVKKMANEIKYITGCSIKEIIENLIRQDIKRSFLLILEATEVINVGGYPMEM